MNRSIELLVLGLALFAGCKPTPVVSNAPPPHHSQDLVIEGATIRYNGQVLPLQGPLGQWVKALGPPSRRIGEWSISDTRIWDALGIYLTLERPERRDGGEFIEDERTVDSLNVVFGPSTVANDGKELHYWPKEPFRGRLVVDGAWVHKNTSPSEINRHKQAPPFRKGYLPDRYFYPLSSGENGMLRLRSPTEVESFIFSLVPPR